MARTAVTWTWTGGTNTVYTTTANWSASGSVGASDYPGKDGAGTIDGDTVILAGAVTNGCATAAGFAGGVGKLVKFIITDSYTKGVGQDAAHPLVIDMAGDGTGEVFIEGTLADNMFISGAATNYIGIVTMLDLQVGKLLTLGGKVATLNLMKGQITTQATAIISSAINVGYVTNETIDATLILTALSGGGSLPANINCQGGTITNNVAFSGIVTIGKAKWTNAAGAIGTLNQYGGQFIWNAAAITTANIFSGAFVCSSGTAARVCTNLYQYTPASVDTNDGRRWVTVTYWHIMCTTPKISVVPGQIISIAGA